MPRSAELDLGDALAPAAESVAADEAAASSPPSRRWFTAAQWVALAAPVLLLAVLAWRNRNLYDDGFIYLRVVDNILHGHGPVFNPGERVEAYTGPLWLAILAIAGLLPVALEWLAVVLGIGFTLAAIILAMVGSSRFYPSNGKERPFLLPLGAITFVVLPPVWVYASTGLETGLTFCWLAGCLAALTWWAKGSTRLAPWGLVLIGLGPLVRPELVLVSTLLLLLVVVAQWAGSSWPGRIATVVWACAIPLTYQVFRMGYFGEMVSSTALAKEGTSLRVPEGLAYGADLITPYYLLIPLLALALGAYLPTALALHRHGRRRQLAVLLTFPACAIVDAAYVIAIGGDYLHARLLLPALFAFLAPVAVVPLSRRYLLSLLVLPWAAVCAVALRHSDAPLPFGQLTGTGRVTVAENGWYSGSPSSSWYTGPGVYVRFGLLTTPATRIAVAPASELHLPAIAMGGIGAESFYRGPDMYVYDWRGLATSLPAHLQLTHRGHQGHEKITPTPWIAAALTAPGSSTAPFDKFQRARDDKLFGNLIPNTTGTELQIQTEWARAALACPRLAEVVDGPKQPLTPATFLRNVVTAPAHSSLRVPPDPEQAYHEFCGPGTPDSVAQLLAERS